MSSKICRICKIEKDVTAFHPQSRRCKPCLAERAKKYRLNNPERIAATVVKSRKKYLTSRRDFLNSLKNKPCADCGQSYPPYVLDFDHVRLDKIDSVSRMNQCPKDVLLAEVAKCDVVCTNCHRIRTHNRSQNNQKRSPVKTRIPERSLTYPA